MLQIYLLTTHRSNGDYSVEVMNINMNEHSEESAENLLAQRHETLGERHVCKESDAFVTQNI